jgi:hypothetical protein
VSDVKERRGDEISGGHLPILLTIMIIVVIIDWSMVDGQW